MGRQSYGLSELWVVGVMGRRNRDLTPRYYSVSDMKALFDSVSVD